MTVKISPEVYIGAFVRYVGTRCNLEDLGIRQEEVDLATADLADREGYVLSELKMRVLEERFPNLVREHWDRGMGERSLEILTEVPEHGIELRVRRATKNGYQRFTLRVEQSGSSKREFPDFINDVASGKDGGDEVRVLFMREINNP